MPDRVRLLASPGRISTPVELSDSSISIDPSIVTSLALSIVTAVNPGASDVSIEPFSVISISPGWPPSATEVLTGVDVDVLISAARACRARDMAETLSIRTLRNRCMQGLWRDGKDPSKVVWEGRHSVSGFREQDTPSRGQARRRCGEQPAGDAVLTGRCLQMCAAELRRRARDVAARHRSRPLGHSATGRRQTLHFLMRREPARTRCRDILAGCRGKLQTSLGGQVSA